MFCTQCGAEIPSANKFCGACGAPAVIPVKKAVAIATDLSGPRAQDPAPIQAPAPAGTATQGLPRRPLLLTLLGVWQLVKAALIFVMLLGFALYLTSAEDTPMTFPLAAVLAALSFLCVLAAAGGIGLLALRPYGRAILLVFACLELAVFPLGTALSIFLFFYLRKPQIKSLFAARPGARSLNLKVLLGVALASALLLGALLMLVEFRGRRSASHQSNPAVAYQPLGVWILTEDGRLSIPDRASTVTERDIADIGVAQDETGAASVWIRFTEEGATKMRELTRNHLGQRIVFMVDGTEYREHAAVIQSVISENASITFSSMDEANAFLNRLKKRQ